MLTEVSGRAPKLIGNLLAHVFPFEKPGVRTSGVVAEVFDLSVLAHVYSATSTTTDTLRIGSSPEEEATIPRYLAQVLARGEERILRVLAALHRASPTSFLDRRERVFRHEAPRFRPI